MAEEGSREPKFAPDPPGSAKQEASVTSFSPDEGSFRALIENGTDVISIQRADGVITYQSPSIKKILGYEQAGLIGQSVFDFIHPDEVERVR
ncbi:MAG TPA: PAS domain S-box protein, partial [Pyrinomonadaceae bacterium]|nr:PAS domain S-box protein [Pyrinomonadaceae bacterium]